MYLYLTTYRKVVERDVTIPEVRLSLDYDFDGLPMIEELFLGTSDMVPNVDGVKNLSTYPFTD